MRSFRFRAALLVAVLAPLSTARAQSVQWTRDVIYGHLDGMALVYDVAVPAEANGVGVIFVISGGFLSTREQQSLIAPVAQPLLDAGFTIFNLRHPSTPRYLAPEIYQAVAEGARHVLENADEFGVDPGRIGSLGMSTGGLLSLLIALDQPADPADAAMRPAASVAYMPITDIRPYVGNVRATPSLGFPGDAAPALSPIDFVSEDDPPVLLIHGSRDQVVDLESNSGRLRQAFEEAGVVSELMVVDGGHELFAGDQKASADAAAVAWFRTHLLD